MSPLVKPLLTPRMLPVPASHPLFSAAMQNAGADKRQRRALRERLWLVQCEEESITAATAHLNNLFSRACRAQQSHPDTLGSFACYLSLTFSCLQTLIRRWSQRMSTPLRAR